MIFYWCMRASEARRTTSINGHSRQVYPLGRAFPYPTHHSAEACVLDAAAGVTGLVLACTIDRFEKPAWRSRDRQRWDSGGGSSPPTPTARSSLWPSSVPCCRRRFTALARYFSCPAGCSPVHGCCGCLVVTSVGEWRAYPPFCPVPHGAVRAGRGVGAGRDAAGCDPVLPISRPSLLNPALRSVEWSRCWATLVRVSCRA